MPYIGNPIYQSAFVTDTFSGDGTTTAFTMSVAPAGTTNVLVSISGVLQDPSTYGVVGTTITFSGAPPSGTGNISCRYLGVPATGVTTTAYRTVTEFTATAAQTTFTPPSYTVGFINVYRNGVLLGSADYTATNGTTVVLTTGATAGDLVTVESFLVSSVLNAIPNTAGSVSASNLVDGSVTTEKIADANVTQAKLGTNVVGNGPSFSAYPSTTQTFSSGATTKVNFDTEEWDTNNNFASSRFTPTVAGYYQINAYMTAIYAGGESALFIHKNGAQARTLQDIQGAYLYMLSGSNVVYCNGTTDYIEIYAYTQNGITNYSGIGRTLFSGSLIRSA